MPRLPFALAAVVTIAAGLGVRAFTDGPFAKYTGDALYTVLLYLLVLVVAPRTRSAVAALIALAASWVIEFAQLLNLPVFLRPILGSTFNPPDLFWYAAGALAAHLAALLVQGRGQRQVSGNRRSRSRTPPPERG
ncbi:DUF2809 domain-containing protein [Nonomuraea sp. NPDC046570]|uniref:DUF2809 domain-containing protein n=1 Tax=Nonomuraea sp. NPDC046570 TaxID=3155255 RepID=UPI0033C329FD